MIESVLNRPLTTKGEQTRSRIIEVAASLMLDDGVAGTTIDDVCEAGRVGKSQVYYYFGDKSDLVRAVIERQADRILGGQEPYLERIQGWESWDEWRDFVVDLQLQRGCVGGCPLGSLASELSDSDELTRTVLAKSFARWERSFAVGVEKMKSLGLLRPDADTAHLAMSLLASLQGGLLLCQTCKDVAPLKTSLNGAIQYMRSYST